VAELAARAAAHGAHVLGGVVRVHRQLLLLLLLRLERVAAVVLEVVEGLVVKPVLLLRVVAGVRLLRVGARVRRRPVRLLRQLVEAAPGG
jgi:hypothetical protein